MVVVRMNDYAFESDLPFLDHLSALEMTRYRHIFKPSGYLYSVFGGMVEGIPALDDYHVVLMLRDPRDVLTSDYFSIAHSHRLPLGRDKIEPFVERRSYARQAGIDRYVLAESDRIRRVYSRYLDLLIDQVPVYVTTYEEMISDFPKWLEGLLNHCELTVSPGLEKELLEQASRSRPTEEDVTKHLRQLLPGDHQRKLQPDTVARLNATFSEILRAFRYI
jgi:hypothetical protein